MSTTIRGLTRWGLGTIAALAAWAVIMLAMPFIGPDGRQVAVVGDEAHAVRAIAAAGGRVIERRRGATLAQGGPGFPGALYRAGAPLVIEGRIAAGCFSPR